jgi:hypothetical protein
MFQSIAPQHRRRPHYFHYECMNFRQNRRHLLLDKKRCLQMELQTESMRRPDKFRLRLKLCCNQSAHLQEKRVYQQLSKK